VGVALIVGATIAQQSVIKGDSDATRLTEFHDHSTKLLWCSIGRGVGFALFAVILVYLFRADMARSERVRSGLVGLMVAGPLFLATTEILTWVALKDIANDFIAAQAKLSHPNLEKLADTLAEDSSLKQAASGFGLAGALGTSVAVFYTSLWASRTGLVTRFVGTFGIAVGAVFLLIPFGVLAWVIMVGAQLLRPQTLPPAWAAGEAVPWPSAGERMAEALKGRQAEGDVVEGEGTEVAPEDQEPEAGTERGPAAPKRKRKRRR
jgi:hypothetical protein